MPPLKAPPYLAQSEIFQSFTPLAFEAGRAIMGVYDRGPSVTLKADASPVTEADGLAEALILEGLGRCLPNIAVVAEEACSSGYFPPTGERFILVDPLDGTKEFISRNGEFTVNIALIEDQVPIAGVIFAPAINRFCYGERGLGAWHCKTDADSTDVVELLPMHTRPQPDGGLVVVASRSHRDAPTDAYLETIAVDTVVSAGSSLKFCLIAAGEADIYPRFGRTMEWDVAAGHAILNAAGGSMVAIDGSPFLYGKRERNFDNPGFIARGWRE